MKKIECLKNRMVGIRDFLALNYPEVSREQKHLDEHSPERGYWHLGYATALDDAIRLLEDTKR